MQQNAIQRNDTNTKLGITNTQNNDAQANTLIILALSITTLSIMKLSLNYSASGASVRSSRWGTLPTSLVNIRLGHKSLPRTNALAYLVSLLEDE
jgi:hypothetical protein